jgi:hypothetical protein
VIENNTISNNVAWPREPSIWNRTCGGGLYRCDGTVQNNVIVGNRANAGSGGGLDGCEGAIRNNIIAGNVAYGDGGGLNGCGGTMENNAIIVNRAEGGVLEVGCGGGLRSCNGVIRGNIIAGNSALYDGGGMDFCTGLIQNCTITGNSAATRGGGLCGCYGKIENCIIWGNTAPSDAQLYESSIPNFSCIEGWTTGGEGNISLDPKFADADGADNDPDTYEDNDYRLLPSSPCIDAGKNEDGMIGAVDLDGNPRIWRGASSWTVDMGAYEYGSFPFRCVAVVKEVSGKCQITWNSRVGDNYTVQSCTDLGAGNWIDAATIASGGETTAWTDPDVSNEVKFYRVEMK